MAAALVRAGQVDQGFFHFAHGLAHAGAVFHHRFVVARRSRIDLGAAGAAVEDGKADGQRTDAPGAGRDAGAASADIALADGAGQAQTRVALRLGAAHFEAGGRHFAFGAVDVGTLAQGLRRQLRNRHGRGRNKGAGRQLLAQRLFRHGRQGHQRLDIHIAGGALFDGAAGAFGGAGAGQGGVGGRLEAGAGAQFRQACRVATREGILFGHGLQLLAGAQGVVLVRHFGGDRDAGLMPAGAGAVVALLRRIARGTVGAKYIDFP